MKLRMHLRDLKFKFGDQFVETESCSETQSSDMQIDLNSEEVSQADGDNAQSQSGQVSTEEDLVGNWFEIWNLNVYRFTVLYFK